MLNHFFYIAYTSSSCCRVGNAHSLVYDICGISGIYIILSAHHHIALFSTGASKDSSIIIFEVVITVCSIHICSGIAVSSKRATLSIGFISMSCVFNKLGMYTTKAQIATAVTTHVIYGIIYLCRCDDCDAVDNDGDVDTCVIVS